MRDPNLGAGVGDPMSPASEVKTAFAGFASDFKSFRDDIHKRLQQQDEKMNKLSTKMAVGRTPLSAGAAVDVPHQKAFAAYLRSGDDDGLRGLEIEGKAMSASVAADGGYLVDPVTSDRIASTLSSMASLRSVASVVQVESAAYDVLIDRGETGAGWATETGPMAETDTAKIERISIALHELSAMPRVSQRLLDDSAFDIEGWLAGRIADKFARAEAAAFINGDGNDKPKGILAETAVKDASWTWGKLGYIATGTAGGFSSTSPAEALVDLSYALPAEYRAGAVFVMNSKTVSAVRKLKDADGRFLWSDSLSAGEPARFLGYRVLVCEDMPDIADGADAIAFGDFAAGYTVAERPDLRVLRDPFSAKPNVLFYANKRVGGGVTDFAAIKLLRFSAS